MSRRSQVFRKSAGLEGTLSPWPFLQVGRRVRVECGPLAGTEGIVLEVKSVCRIVVSLTLLQRSVSAEIEREWIRPVH